MTTTEQDIPIYTVTVLDVRNTECPGYWRTPAIFTNLKDAIRVVRDNNLDISDGGTNQYAVVEKTYLNQIYPLAWESEADRERYWFEWNPVEEEYVEAEIPQKYVRVYSFGIG